jgi:DNA-binding beta-propeller fold protein YncE
MKRLTVLTMFLLFGLFSLVSAEQEIGVFVNSNTNCIQFIDPATNIATVNYLGGELGTYGGGLFDVVITHNGKTAIVSNFGDSRIFFIDISGGFANPPTVPYSRRIGFFAEDMVITPNDQYVLIADGGFSPRVAAVELGNGHFKINDLGTRYANAIDITPDGQTVLVADYFTDKIHAYSLNYDDGSLIHKKSVRIVPFKPVNIAISPDGRTVIAVIAGSSACTILYFDTAGELHYKETIGMPSMNGQSCVFSKDGTKAYYLSNSQNSGTRVVILNVTGVGQVSPSGTSIKIWPRRGTSQLFGVDTIALNSDESFLYVTNPTLSGGIYDVAVIDLNINQQVGYIPAHGIPTGIAFTEIED